MPTIIPLRTCVRVPVTVPILVGGLLLQENVEWKVNQSHKESRSVKQEPWEPKQTSRLTSQRLLYTTRVLGSFRKSPSFYFNAARQNVHSIHYFAFFQWIIVIVGTSHKDIIIRRGILKKRNIEILVAHRKIYTIITIGSWIVPFRWMAHCYSCSHA